MGLTLAKCPACGADLNLETDRDYFYCPHCGSKVLQVEDRIVIEHVDRKVDEAEVQKVAFEREKYAHEEEIREERRKKNVKRTIPIFVAGAIAFVAGLIADSVSQSHYDQTGFNLKAIGFSLLLIASMVFFTNYFHLPDNNADISRNTNNTERKQ